MEKFNNIACCLATYHDLIDGYFMYDPVFHCIRYTTTGMDPNDKQVMSYCPHCGSQLPNYNDEFFEELEKEIGKNGDYENLPEEFQNDEWWKKRKITGLGSYWRKYSPVNMHKHNKERGG